MKLFVALLSLTLAYNSYAQSSCTPASITSAAVNIKTIQHTLTLVHFEEGYSNVPFEASKLITELKDALTSFADASLVCVQPAVNPIELEKTFASTLSANPALSSEVDAESNGSYGHNLRVSITHPKAPVDLLEIQFSINIECGNDTMLLIYQIEGNHWTQKLRWQAPALNQISDAFGDFFLTTYLDDAVVSSSTPPQWGVVVAHGTPWCQSRWSNFEMDILYPTSKPASPEVAWHANRSFSRGDFETKLKSSANTFELRTKTMCMDATAYECHVIYHFEVDAHHQPHRIQPIATNARGFVEEWLSSPWGESQNFIAPENSVALQKTHDQYNIPLKVTDKQFMDYSYGPVRACSNKGTYQIEIDLSLNTFVSGKPGGDFESKGAWYFHVHELKNGYQLLSVTTTADSNCVGPDLMSVNGQ